MIESLDALDKDVFLFLNGIHASWMDPIMWWVSGTITWAPLYLVLLFFMFKKVNPTWRLQNWKNWLALIIGVFLTVLFADQISSGFFKPFFGRLRPSHSPELEGLVHLLFNSEGEIYRGGQFGFVSSHAANSFALAFFVSSVINKKWFWYGMFGWAIIVSYSRIYLGVHYPGDIIVGAMVGLFSGWLAYQAFKYLYTKWAI